MSEKIDPREVLAYLNELGYTNINAHQLKEFIKDLKKIIKYDSRYGGTPQTALREASYGEEGNYCECSSDEKENRNLIGGTSINPNDNFVSSRNPNIETNNDKKVQRDKHIAVHIYDTKRRKVIDHEHCVHVNPLDEKSSQLRHDKSKMTSNLICTSTSSKDQPTESTIKSIPPCSSTDLMPFRTSKTSCRDRKSKVTFIRPAISKPSINKSDPVALYHYYQSEWKKTKIPGQDSRADLRWAVRERMLSGPKVEVRSRCNIPRCGWTR